MVTAPDNQEEDLAEGTLLSHLVELRSRLLKIAASVLLVFVMLLPFARRIFEFASEPLRKVLPGGQMIATAVTSPLLAPFKLCFYMALFIAMPIVLHQLWAFVAPGLYRKEKRFAFPLLASSIVLFPLIFGFMTAIAPEGVEVMTDVTSYLDFIMMIVLAFGLAFETPIATVLIVWTGLTTVDRLGKARP